MRTEARQLSFPAPRTWGGRRKGAGRKRRRARPGVPHVRRPALSPRVPVHVTIRLRADLPSLRKRELYRQLRKQFLRAKKPRFRICEFSVQRNHVHLVCEAADAQALSRGMQGFEIGVAHRINGVLGRRGGVFDDRYHAEQLTTPRQVRNALCYVLQNSRRHRPELRTAKGWVDPCSSARSFDGWATALPPPTAPDACLVAPAETWLLSTGWRRHGLIGVDEAPRAR
jgi:REP element-mobilizing transposase RayT